jgi:hypothetical protein
MRRGVGTKRGVTDKTASPNERFHAPKADRPPTTDEEQAAERGAADVDLEEVGAHYEEMAEIGKNVKGEGNLFPSED